MEVQRGLIRFNAKTHSGILKYHFVMFFTFLNITFSVCKEKKLKTLNLNFFITIELDMKKVWLTK